MGHRTVNEWQSQSQVVAGPQMWFWEQSRKVGREMDLVNNGPRAGWNLRAKTGRSEKPL